jgi:hypothetical protein
MLSLLLSTLETIITNLFYFALQSRQYDLQSILRQSKGGFSMFRVWGRTFKSNKMLQSTTIELEINDTRTHKIFKALEMICDEFDLSNPIWLDTNINEFKRISRTRFYSDSFVESIDFDYLDFYVIEED